MQKIKNDEGLECSKSTIHDRLHKCGFNTTHYVRKPLLTQKHLDDRKKWAIMYDCKNFDNIIWSDETIICNDNNSNTIIWVHKDDPIEIKRTVKMPLKVSIWGCMLKHNHLIIKVYDGTINGTRYIDILTENLLPLIKQNSTRTLMFQQDNATCHVCKISKTFFNNNNIQLMFWPANSPDLNPIENVWNLIKNKLKYVYFNTKSDMINGIQTVIKELDKNITNNLISTMQNRINALFKNNFDSIDY
jgi:transposase